MDLFTNNLIVIFDDIGRIDDLSNLNGGTRKSSPIFPLCLKGVGDIRVLFLPGSLESLQIPISSWSIRGNSFRAPDNGFYVFPNPEF